MRIYKPNRAATKGGLVLLVAISLYVVALFLERWTDNMSGHIDISIILAVLILYVPGIILTFLPLCFKLEVGNDYIKMSFLGVSYGYTRSLDVRNMVYKDLTLFGGFKIGKGIYFETIINGKRDARSVGEMYFGKEGVADAKRALESNIAHAPINDVQA